MDLQDATVLITGATGGFGLEFMRQCLAAGSNLIVTDLSGPRLEANVAAIRQKEKRGSIIQQIAADLSSAEGCVKLVNAVTHTPDILINNAGVAMYGRFSDTPRRSWETLMQVNLMAPMRLTYGFLPAMIKRGSGHIVNLSSMAGWVGTRGLAPYSASKYGLRGFGEALADELAYHNIHVTNVYPFYSKTPILDSPQYGSLHRPELPDDMVSDPVEVVREVLEAVQQNEVHVFPDKVARRLHLFKRFIPKIIPKLFGD